MEGAGTVTQDDHFSADALLSALQASEQRTREDISNLRKESREDHDKVIKKVEDLTSEVRIANSTAAAAHRLGESNAADIERIERQLAEQRAVFEEAGGLRRFVSTFLRLVGDHDHAKAVEEGMQKERKKWMAPLRKAIDETPKLLLGIAALAMGGVGYLIAVLS